MVSKIFDGMVLENGDLFCSHGTKMRVQYAFFMPYGDT